MIDFCVVGKVGHHFLKDVKVIRGELLHNLVIVDVDRKEIRKTWWEVEDSKGNVAKLIEEPYRQFLECRVPETMSDSNHVLWYPFKKVC